MPALEISRSMLVNHGLSAIPDMARLAENGDGPQSAPSDVVESFKRLVASDAIADRDLAATVVAFSSPLDLATYFINAKYAELGGPSGQLGSTTSAVGATSNNVGFVRTFQHGAIYFHPQVGAHALYGPIRARWQELGAEKSFLGFPTSDITPGADVRAEGSFAHFQGGSIYWAPLPIRTGAAAGVVTGDLVAAALTPSAPPTSPTISGSPALRVSLSASALSPAEATTVSVRPVTTSGIASGIGTAAGDLDVGIIREPAVSSAGAFEVHGDIREKYLALGAEASILGYPRTDETATPDGVGRFNHFQGGSIYWTPGTFAHEVHGLIRDLWAQLGWERNPQLGYPITDELIPDRRVGHRRPEVRKKPILELPVDRIKLPADAAAAGFPTAVVNVPLSAAPAPSVPVARALSLSPTTATLTRPSALGRLSDRATGPIVSPTAPTVTPSVTPTLPASVAATLGPELTSVVISAGPASTPADVRSVNRFADFESGVLFWQRGATAAATLSPVTTTSDGTSLSFSGADVAAATIARIGRSTFEQPNVQLASATFMGTTGYSYDGSQVHNRRHRVQVIVSGIESLPTGLFGAQVPTPVTATIELQVEVWFDPAQRRIALTPTDWSRTQASSGSYGAAVDAMLRAKLDPILWTSYELVTLPDTDNGEPIAVLSVKTLGNGAVAVFVEPRRNLVLGSITEFSNAVTPTVVNLAQPK